MATLAGGEPFIGVDYGRDGNNLPSLAQVVTLLRNRGVKHVKIYDADQDVLTAFKDSGIELSVAVPNTDVIAIANNQSDSDAWVSNHIINHVGSITSIGVGNEWLYDPSHDKSKLVPAMENLYRSLQKQTSTNNIKVSTPHAFDVVQGYPPSQGEFLNKDVMVPLLEFLKRTNSFFMLNCYPFFAYVDEPRIDTNYALFTATNPVIEDQGRGYTNLFDAMVDTVISAMKQVGYPDVPIEITETGWPNGGSSRRGVGVENARVYNQNVIKHVVGKNGTPLRPGQSFPTYIFALFNENGKIGVHGDEEKHWGLFNPDMTPIYPLSFA